MKTYFFPLLLLSSALLGGIVGHFFGHQATMLKPLGDLFLNLLLTAIVPLIFFSIANAIARLGAAKQVFKTILNMLFTFTATGIVAAIFMLIVVKIFPPIHTSMMHLPSVEQAQPISILKTAVETLTVSEFYQLFSPNHLLPLIIFSFLIGIGTLLAKEKSNLFKSFLESGAAILQHVVGMIMIFAPIGFFAFFAALVGDLGDTILHDYLRVTLIYYIAGFSYFIFAFTLYAFFANRSKGILLFWRNISLPMITSFATCSSVASIPANMQAAKKMSIASSIYTTVIPMGAVLHKEGSVLGGMLKIAFLFGVFHLDFTGTSVFLTAIGASLIVGLVMGAIPSGGMLGELFILSVYGFPPQTLMVIAAISIIIDPLATMINVTGDTVACMLTARLTGPSVCVPVIEVAQSRPSDMCA